MLTLTLTLALILAQTLAQTLALPLSSVIHFPHFLAYQMSQEKAITMCPITENNKSENCSPYRL